MTIIAVFLLSEKSSIPSHLVFFVMVGLETLGCSRRRRRLSGEEANPFYAIFCLPCVFLPRKWGGKREREGRKEAKKIPLEAASDAVTDGRRRSGSSAFRSFLPKCAKMWQNAPKMSYFINLCFEFQMPNLMRQIEPNMRQFGAGAPDVDTLIERRRVRSPSIYTCVR